MNQLLIILIRYDTMQEIKKLSVVILITSNQKQKKKKLKQTNCLHTRTKITRLKWNGIETGYIVMGSRS